MHRRQTDIGRAQALRCAQHVLSKHRTVALDGLMFVLLLCEV